MRYTYSAWTTSNVYVETREKWSNWPSLENEKEIQFDPHRALIWSPREVEMDNSKQDVQVDYPVRVV